MFWLGKLLQPLLWPYNQALIWLTVAVVLLWRGKIRPARIITTCVLAMLLLFSMPWLALKLFLPLETTHLPRPYESYPKAEAIVVLGGTVSSLTPPRVEVEEMHGSRLIPALRLWKMKKAPIIVLSSGSSYEKPVHTSRPNTTGGRRRTEADDMRELLLALGADDSALVMENRSRNTYENARFTAEYLHANKIKNILLVTSAFHMRRAVPLFEAEGLTVTPVATEHRLMDRPFVFWDLVPDLSSLGLFTAAVKERIGFFVYGLVLKFRKKDAS